MEYITYYLKCKSDFQKKIKKNIQKNPIAKNSVISGQRQVEKFANAIEESYQESLHRAPTPDLRITHLRGSEGIKNFMTRRKKTNA